MLSDDQKIQLLLVGGPILSLIGTLMSLRTYSRLKQKSKTSNKETHLPAHLPPLNNASDLSHIAPRVDETK